MSGLSDTGNRVEKRSIEMLQNVRIFVASPGDVTKEREHLRQVADKLNQSIAHELGFNVEIVGWETHVIPEMGERPQAIINKQIDPYDVFVGVMWKRFGTPTGEAESGTEEEFNIAFECRKKFGTPCILFYFNQEPFMPRTPQDLKQMEKVMEFRDRLSQEGLFWEYTGSESFRDIVDTHLSRLIVQWSKRKEEETPKPKKEQVLEPYFAQPYALQENFVGRQKERDLLSEWLEQDPTSMIALVAIGGMGKSALSWYWLNEDILGKGKQFDGVVWWSFYDKEASFERFLDNSISYASRQAINPKELESTWDKMRVFFNLYRESNYLVVLDGVERLLRAYAGLGSPYQGDAVKEDEKQDFRACIEPNVAKFLQWLSAGYPQTKTIITTRLFPKELDGIAGCRYVNLEWMINEDAVEFFHRQGVTGARAEIETACGSVDYLPLSLRLLSGMIVHDPKNPGDIQEWRKYNPLPELKGKEGHHILELSYDALDKQKQQFISRLAAFRTPMDYDALAIFNDFGSDEKFNKILRELVDRGLLFRDEKSSKFDLHPIVRRYCYERLKNKESIHSVLIDYFAYIPAPEKIESVDDLASVIELYHHTVRAGKYDEAFSLLRERLVPNPLHFQLGEYQTIIELEKEFFEDAGYRKCRLKDESKQAWLYNALANSYSLSGQPRKAIPLLELSNEIDEKRKYKKGVARGLDNLADDQMKIGELDAAEANFRRSIEICRENEDEFPEAVGHQELGRLLAYRGEFEESEHELEKAIDALEKIEYDYIGHTWNYYSIRSILMANADEALNHAKTARELAERGGHVGKLERDIIHAEYLLGASYLMNGNLVDAEKHLSEALTRDRKTNLVEFEPDILLEFAKLRFKEDRKKEALEHAEEALQIADRCEYRLKQADIHNFLAEFYLDAGELGKAKAHAATAKERAECGYKPAMEKAENLLKEIEQRST
jgi:tetratricopeptide (TPR) repeat protein